MTEYLSCPVCGKLTPLSNFDPEALDDDVVIVTMESRGRHGFEVVDRRSALDDEELMNVIADRLRLLLSIVEGEGDAT